MYIALRRLKIGDGYREIGEPVPEAADWPNAQAYVSSGYIAGAPDPVDPNAAPPEPGGEPMTDADLILMVAASIEERAAAGEFDAEVADLGGAVSELVRVVGEFGEVPGDNDPASPESGDTPPSNGSEPNDRETVERTEPEQPLNLSRMTREELNAHAAEIGVESPGSYDTKADLVAAIEQKAG